jgi:hypothetical protein
MKSSWIYAHLQKPFDPQLPFSLPLSVAEANDNNNDD